MSRVSRLTQALYAVEPSHSPGLRASEGHLKETDDIMADSAKKKGGIGAWTIARRVVQIVMLCLFAMPLLLTGWGLAGAYVGTGGEYALDYIPADVAVWGSLSSSQIVGIDLLDPFATAQVIAAAKTVVGTMVWCLPILVGFALVRGRAFCGWVCPVNLLGEAVDWLRGKLKIEVSEMPLPRWTKVAVAAGVLVLSAITSIPVFESISPIGAFSRGLLFGSLLGVWTLVAIVIAELFWGHRVWCRALCPLGGFYQVVGTVGLLSVKIDHDSCIKCNKCKKACIVDPSVLDAAIAGDADRVASGDCMICGKCVDHCPTGSLKIAPAPPGLKL